MSYTPTEWQSGDIVTSTKLNKLENGVAAASGGGVLVVNVAMNEAQTAYVMDKTYAEIHAALLTGAVFTVNQVDTAGGYQISADQIVADVHDSGQAEAPYVLTTYNGGNSSTFIAATEDDYPAYTPEDNGGGGGEGW